MVTLRFGDPTMQFQVDDVGANRTGVSVLQEPLTPGEHSVWFTLGDRQYRTPKFLVTAGAQSTLELAVTAEGGRAMLNGHMLAVTPLAKQEPLPPTFKNSIGMEFVKVPKGKSWLGGGKDKLGDQEVEFPADFYLGKYVVTQEEWEKIMGENPSEFSRTGAAKDRVKDIPEADLKRFPVETVSWDQCQLFVAKLNKLEKDPGWIYRLPKDVEWEYACRNGPQPDRLESAFDYYFARPMNTLSPQLA